MSKKIFYWLLLATFLIPISGYGQVTIGSAVEPELFSILKLDNDNQALGLRLPRLDQLGVNNLQSVILTSPTDIQARAEGLMIYNTSIHCTMVWNSIKFISLCGDIEPAIIQDISNCGAIQVIGTYTQGTALNPTTNYITVPITVEVRGSYNLTATTGNGYSFVANGTLLDPGNYVITLRGQGTPLQAGTNQITLTINNTQQSCTNTISVAPAVTLAQYSIQCVNSQINGSYIINQTLGSTNTVSLVVDVTTPGFYSFNAESNGVRFTGSGQFTTAGTGQSITLFGSGAPTAAGVININIIGETATGNVTCPKTFQVAYRLIRILGLGQLGYQPASSPAGYSSREILVSPNNFNATNATVLVSGITLIDGGFTAGTALQNSINTNNPDIIIVGYSYIPDVATAAVLANFVRTQGGVVLFFCEGGSAVQNMLNQLYSVSNITSTGRNGGGAVYQMANIPTDPILSGPFGNIAGQFWGEDASATQHVSNNLPAGTIIYSNGIPTLAGATDVTMFRHATLGFVYAGDGGFLAGNATDNSLTLFPARHLANGVPTFKNYGLAGYNGPRNVYNAVFYANALAWAINYVQLNR